MAIKLDARLGELAEARGGCWTREIAREAKLSDAAIRNRIDSKAWVQLAPGVWRARGTPRTRRMAERAALDYLGPESFLSHGSSGSKHGLVDDPSTVWASVHWRRRCKGPDWLTIVRTRHVEYEELSNGMRVATAPRAMADLAMCLDRRQLAAALAKGVQAGKLTVDDVVEEVDRLKGRPGYADITAVLTEFKPAFESILSMDLFDLIALAGIADVEPAVRVALPNGRSATLDFGIRRLRLGFEADGFAYHGSKGQQDADKARDVQLGLAMWRVVRFTTDQIRRRRYEVLRSLPAIVEARVNELSLGDRGAGTSESRLWVPR